jgi:DNA recombination protein RmuC
MSSMNELFFVLIILGSVMVGGAAVFFLLRRKEAKPSDSFLMLQQQLQEMRQAMDGKLSESNKVAQFQLSQSAQIIKDVTEKLTRLDETNKQVVSFADQLQEMQDILKNPKQRGVLGEFFLETVLKNVLPPGSFQMQYSFRDGQIVDAVIFVDKRIIPIDSKFSLENYNRMIEAREQSEKKKYESAFINDLKMRIEETAKYVRPEERTMDFAFMFIPAEAVYYDLLINKVGAIAEDTNNLIYHAGKKKVIIVSPTSFLAYLQTVLQGLRNQKISEQAHAIIGQVERLGKHLFTYSEYMQRLGDHLCDTVGSYNKAGKELAKIDKDVVKITGREPKIEMEEVEKPLLEE